jgi:hypothetical protein
VPYLAASKRHFELVGIPVFHLLGAGELHPGTPGGVIDEEAVDAGLRRRLLHLIRRVRIPAAAAKIGTLFPSLRAVKHLHGSLALELDFEPRLLRPLKFEREGQQGLLALLGLELAAGGDLVDGGARAELPLPGHGLHPVPGRQTPAGRDVLLDDLRRGQPA